MKLTTFLAAGAAAALLLTGCSAGSGDTATDGGMPAVMSDDQAYLSESGGDAAGAADEDVQPGAPGELQVDPDYLVRRASLGIKVDDIFAAAVQVRQIAAAADGLVVNEHFGDEMIYGTSNLNRFGMMTISVPSEELDPTLDRLGEIGEVRSRSSESVDVKDEYVDVEARIKTLTASIERMRDLMTQTDDVEQIVRLETALSARQADLDSLQARLNNLTASIAMSPVDISLTTTDDLYSDETGFIGAFKDAWNDFKASATVLVRATGALLPWVITGGLAAWLLVWGVRRTRRTRAGAATAESTAPTPSPDPTPTKAP